MNIIEKIEQILEEVSVEYVLTYGEKVRILASRIQGESKYVLSFFIFGEIIYIL